MPDIVRITVIHKAFYPEMADKYLAKGRDAGACPALAEGQTFLYEGNAKMPEGFCPWAWIDIFHSCATLHASGFDNQWYARGNLRVQCCSDGVRPVSFLLEVIE